MTYLLLACPKCHAAYKIARELADSEVVCRSCGHRWVPRTVSAAPGEGPALAPAGGAPGEAAAKPAAEPPPRPPGAVGELAAAARETRAASDAKTPREEKADPLIGTTIGGFKIQSRLGSGGFGVVYRAFDTNLERSVAIKMLPAKLARTGQGLLERFLREARSAAKLSHPNIVTIHQICPHKDTYYIVMELVDGGALHEFLAVQRRFRPAEATRVIRAAAEGLGHAHRRGIIHRDVKPGNIMMTNDGQVKVSDFGLARDVLQGHDIVGPGHSLGTPRYMAPEQALGEEPTAASDLYSLAATFYALLVGRPPFDGATDREIMKKHVQETVPDPRQFVPNLPVAVYRFFEKAMAKEPGDRYQTAEEFIEALDRLDFSFADGATPTTPQALSAQIGPIAPEDRGSHLTESLHRVVRQSQRGRTPLSHAGIGEIAAGRRRGLGGLLWFFIGLMLAILVGGAIVAAILLKPPATAPRSSPPAPLPNRPATSGASMAPPSAPPAAAPVAPTSKVPILGPKPPTPVPAPVAAPPPPPRPRPVAEPKAPEAPLSLEDAAQEALNDVKKYVASPDVTPLDAIERYRDVIRYYPKTKAAMEAQKVIDAIQAKEAGGKGGP